MTNNNGKKGGGCLGMTLFLLILIGLTVWGTLSISNAFEVRNLKLDMREAEEKAREEYIDSGYRTPIEETESGREYLRLRKELIERGEIRPEEETLKFAQISGGNSAPSIDYEAPSVDYGTTPEQNTAQETGSADASDDQSFASLMDKIWGDRDNSDEQTASDEAKPVQTPKPEKEQPKKDKETDQGNTDGLTAEQLETMKHIEAWLAEYYSDTEFYTCSFRFKQLGMNDRYIYEIHRTSDLLDETFYISCLRSKVGSKWGVDGKVVRNVSSLPHTYDWNLDGTWTYRDSGNDYTLTVRDVRMDPATENSELQEFFLTVSYQLTGDGEPLAHVENQQVSICVYTDNVSRNDFNNWYIIGDEGGHSVWLYPMGGESTKDGRGIGFRVNGYWLTR